MTQPRGCKPNPYTPHPHHEVTHNHRYPNNHHVANHNNHLTTIVISKSLKNPYLNATFATVVGHDKVHNGASTFSQYCCVRKVEDGLCCIGGVVVNQWRKEDGSSFSMVNRDNATTEMLLLCIQHADEVLQAVINEYKTPQYRRRKIGTGSMSSERDDTDALARVGLGPPQAEINPFQSNFSTR
ncbi:hypothetical protein RIF29_34319 [Crotalaria pallida]|uniref:Uncharacterized protein n=1 Tax=Crotalaria pallida TaxID=3830 RepID=A0AAN9HTH1_CROPI